MKTLSGSLYDYLLFYECASKDWLNGKGSQKLQIVQQAPGTLMNYINWGVTGTTVPGDSGGNTKCGITHGTWSSWYGKNASKYGLATGPNVDNMDKKGWMSYIDHSWINCANEACSLVLFQGKWGGWGSDSLNRCLSALKERADKQGYNFKTSGGIYAQIADATFAYNNPMDAFQIIRNAHQQYLYDISAPGKKNRKFRQGWMRREVAPFQDDGLYVETGGIMRYTNENTTLQDWRAICNQKKGNIDGYVKLCSWDNMPTNPEAYADIDLSVYDNGGDSGGSSSGGGSGSFGGSGSGTGSGYSPKFSAAANRDPHLSASKPVELRKGTLLGSEFNVK